MHPISFGRLALTMLLTLGWVGLATAQYNPFPRYTPPGIGNRVPPLPGVQNRPSLTPYLNLLRGGNPAANYYLGVVPEIQRRQNLRQIDASLQYLDTRITTQQPADPEQAGGLNETGHPVQFLNLGPYYGGANLPQVPRRPNPPSGGSGRGAGGRSTPGTPSTR